VSAIGNDGGRCTRAAPCASFERAYSLARPGDVVEIAGGNYPSQAIEFRTELRNTPCAPSNTSRCVTFAPAPGATVTVDGNVEIRGSGVRLKGTPSPSGGMPTRNRKFNTRISGYVSVEATSDSRWPDHVVLDGINTGNFAVGGSDYVTLRNVDVGPSLLDWAGRCTRLENRITANGGYAHEPRYVTLDRVRVHNQNRTQNAADNGCHTGGLFLIAGSYITIRNSVFSQNVVYNIQVQNFGGGDNPPNVTLENNWFGCPVENLYVPGGETTCNGQDDIQFAAALPSRNWLIRYNSFGGGIGEYRDGASYENIRVVGNVGSGSSSCLTGVVYGFNAWRGGRPCAATDVMLPRSPFASDSPGSEDFTLQPGTRASSFVAGSGRDYELRTDIAGRLRPVRYRRDAGASQRETAAIVLGSSIGAAKIGMARADAQTLYGNPRRVRRGTLGAQKRPVRTALYRVPGGFMSAISDEDDTVVGLSTASQYYSTWTGIGPGAPVNGRRRLAGARWSDCLKAFRRVVRGRAVHLYADAKRQTVTRVAMYARGYEPRCER